MPGIIGSVLGLVGPVSVYCDWMRWRVEMLVKANSKPHDIVIYTDGSVTRDRSGWGFTVKQGGRTVHEDSGAYRVTTSSRPWR